MEILLPYGTQQRRINVPDRSVVIRSHAALPLPDPHAAFDEAVRDPVNTASLASLVRSTDRVAIAISDITRPTPNHLLVPWILETLAFVPREQCAILIGNGSHRAMTRTELVQMLGEDIVATVPIVNHDATDAEMLTFLGDTASGTPVWINRHYIEADVRIVTGFIEPHFFAGFSGGPKGVIPGLAGLETIQALHSATLIDHPHSTWMELDANPIHQAIHAAVDLCPPEFLINVTLDPAHQITGIFAGEYRAAHRAGCDALSHNAPNVAQQGFDLVITSNAGYPLDQNLYQSVKGMTAAARLARPGGAIVLVAECRDGLPAHGSYQQILAHASSAKALLAMIHQPWFQMPDQWQVQKQALVQEQAQVYLHSSLDDQVVRDALLTPAPDLQATIDAQITALGQHCHVAVLPEGPMTVMQVC
jgi:lactate racemase